MTTTTDDRHAEVAKLTEILRAQTQSLKVQYLELTEKYAHVEFTQITKAQAWDLREWQNRRNVRFKRVCSYLGSRRRQDHIHDENCTQYDAPDYDLPDGTGRTDYENMKRDRQAKDDQHACKMAYEKGEPAFVARALKNAEAHYEDSLAKLAYRCHGKGIRPTSKLEVKTAHIDRNITTVLTDGTVNVKAWTIIASGPVQRPHYRYLIK